MFRIGIVALLALFLNACAAVYHAAEDGSSGYRDLEVDKGIFYVEYTESVSRDWDTIHGFAQKRCAEITVEQGYKFFDVLSKDQRTVFLDSNVDSVIVTSFGGGPVGSETSPVSTSYSTEGKKVEGRRVIYKIRLSNQ